MIVCILDFDRARLVPSLCRLEISEQVSGWHAIHWTDLLLTCQLRSSVRI